MELNITREAAWDWLIQWNEDEFHLKHGRIVEGVMRYFAKMLV